MDELEITSYKIENVIRFRGEIHNSKTRDALEKLYKHIEDNGAIRSDEVITATHVLYLESRISDMEIIVSIDRAIPSTDEYEYIPIFELEECVVTKHRGHPSLLPVTYTRLYHECQSMGLDVKPPFYNVVNSDMDDVWDFGGRGVDVYVGVGVVLKS